MSFKPSLITGKVLNSAAKPVANARVYFVEGPVSLPDIAVLTDQEGKFTLSAPAAGTYQIGCMADGFSPARLKVTVNGEPQIQVEIRLQP